MKFLNKSIFYLSVGATLLVVSCADESPWGGGNATEGKIELNLLTDSYVTMGTRADESGDTKAMVPDVSKFSVSLKRTDGSYSKTWQTLDAFKKEEGFPQGNYTIAAFYGDVDSEGFDKPYYYGETSIQVKLGETSAETVTASLANAMLSVRYTDELKGMMKNYSASVQTEGHSPVIYAYNEDRPSYLSPGDANVFVTLTNDKDEQVTVNPAKVSLTAKHHYVVTIGVKADNAGTSALDVQITEDIFTEDPISIVLSDELFSSNPPIVEASDFESGVMKEYFESFADEKANPEIHVVAMSGIKSAILTLTSDSSLPVFGGTSYSVDLITADADAKAKLADAKLNCYGFFENVDKMGVVNLKDYVNNLTDGTYTVSLQVTDNNGKSSAMDDSMVKYIVKVTGLEYQISKVETPKFLDEVLMVSLTTNCENLKDKFTFYATNKNGEIVEVKEAVLQSSSSDSGKFTYVYKLTVDPIDECEWTVKAQYGDRRSVEKLVDVTMPTFKVETDAFAKRVKIRISEVTNSNLSASQLLPYLKIKNNGAEISATSIDMSLAEQNIIIVKGLNSKNETVNNSVFDGVYSKFSLNLGTKVSDKYQGTPVPSFTTEEALDVPNGDFEEFSEIEYSGTANQSNRWRATYLSSWSQNTSTFKFREAKFWATTNMKTMNNKTTHSSVDNTWFNQPSVFSTSLEYSSYNGGIGSVTASTSTPSSFSGFKVHDDKGNAMIIRNVGWDPSGQVPKEDQGTAYASGNYYNHNIPNVSQHSVGKMFLGSYSYNNGDNFQEGIEFKSRPSKIKGWYYYTPDSQELGEYGTIVFKIFGEKDIILATGTSNFYSNSDYVQFEIPIEYKNEDFQKEAKKLSIIISSSYHNDGNEVKISTYLSPYECYMHGATLVVDDFEFVYE